MLSSGATGLVSEPSKLPTYGLIEYVELPLNSKSGDSAIVKPPPHQLGVMPRFKDQDMLSGPVSPGESASFIGNEAGGWMLLDCPMHLEPTAAAQPPGWKPLERRTQWERMLDED